MIPDLAGLFTQAFMRNALIAGTGIALVSGFASYFLVLRRQVFTGDALGHVAFTGALGALAIGIDARVGLFGACIAVGLLLALLGPRGRAADTAIGSVFAWILGMGVLFLSLFTASKSTGNGAAGARVLFGSIFGLTTGQALGAVVIAGAATLALVVIARPLLFATADEEVAAARGVPVRVLGLLFLGIVGLVAAEAAQAVGALLLLGLLAGPGGIALCVTSRPYAGMLVSAAVAVGAVLTGLVLSYVVPALPPSFAILTVIGVGYAAALARRRQFGGAT